jgi:2-octaprenyl-6-methoxyphenol hydroxylase
MTKNFDIAIIGGGLAGLTLSILLGNQGWNVACIDRDVPEIGKDTRTTAISWGSRNLLKNANIWPDLDHKSQCISDIAILDEDSPIQLDFKSSDINAEGFGWIVDNRDIRQSLLTHVQNHKNITHITGQSVEKFMSKDDHVTVILSNGNKVMAKLIVGADGRKSTTRDHMGIQTWAHDYEESAIVCLINHTKPHNGLALEHFRTQGPFAVLPYTDDKNGNHRSAIVWTSPKSEIDTWMNCDEDIFNAALQTRCGDFYGDVTLAGSRAAWPLNIVKAKSYIADRFVLVAEAAHGIHPIAGQGLNMSFRDLAALSEVLEGQSDPGNPDALKKYQKMRRVDNMAMAGATHILNHLFENNLFATRALRRFGLHAVSKIPFAKRFFMKQAMGASGNLPDMIKRVV